MPLLEGEPIYTGGESWQQKFQAPAAVDSDAPGPYHAWHRTWHLHPGLTSTGQFETTAPVPSSVLLTRPWDAPAMRTEVAAGPIAWRAAMEGVTTVSDEPWAFEIDHRNGKMKCLACCASARGECGLDTCGLKPPPIPQEFLAIGGGEGVYRPGPAQLAPQPVPGPYGCARRAPCFNRAATALTPRPPRARSDVVPPEGHHRHHHGHHAGGDANPPRCAPQQRTSLRLGLNALPRLCARNGSADSRRACSPTQLQRQRVPPGAAEDGASAVLSHTRGAASGGGVAARLTTLGWRRLACNATLTIPDACDAAG